ncbi:Tubby-related protein 4 [Zootermopsis nevadensis]|uniref:Tubby-related protein 4 n=1 Tax=Zootermopsis nevadensis TaxID=136037 RepID=A0A067QXP6_ZOONE|nr:Tubby-related protein 4 [Zootermopsis nevadensis]
MHLHFERNTNAKCDCAILSLTWMGKVPDELPEDEGWKLNRTNYYQEGWLATGNVRGIVGVTFTTSHCKKAVDFPLRTNYNLRGHRSEVILVKWNEPYQKLASCDSSGIIFVWIKYEGRWSIELINDRNTPVTHFSWSHDGRMALICYQASRAAYDGFVLVGSVAGQRYWSSMLTLDSTITCGIWTPDDQQVYFGTTAGQIIVMDVHGAMVSQVKLSNDVGITMMAWSCEKFKMEEGDETEPVVGQYSPPADDRIFILAVSLQNGYIFLMKSFDDVSPIQVHTGLSGPLCLEWSNSRELLAVAGTMQQTVSASNGTQQPSPDSRTASAPTVEYTNVLKFYSDTEIRLPFAVMYTLTFQSPVTALTWGHNDKRLFIATGCQVHIAWVSRRVASLQLMCRLCIHSQLRGGESQVAALPLPPRIKALISNLFAQTIRCCVPDSSALREFVSRPPAGSVRLHCTMIRHDDDSNLSSGTCYTLYLEYLGGLVPLLKGKRTSKIRPEFVIFDPQLDVDSTDSAKSSGSSQNAASDTSDTEREDGCGSPRVQRRKRRRNKSHNGGADRSMGTAADGDQDDLAYIDTLPEHIRLVEVTSNIWGTKFKIHGLASSVPANLGQVTYKTSLLHLQPRQMTLVMTELRDDFPPGPDPNFNPNLFSEDEEEVFQQEEHGCGRMQADIAPPIAPMTPRPHHSVPGSTTGRFAAQPRPKSSQIPPPQYITATENHHITETSMVVNGTLVPALAKTESYEDEFPYVELTDMVHYCCVGGTGTQTTRHISPLMCEGAVPTLQSPKNAVAPSEVLIDRNPSSQTMMTAATSSDHTGNIQRMKSVLAEQHSQNQNVVALNLNLNLCTIEQNNIDLRPVVMKRIDNEGNSFNNSNNNNKKLHQIYNCSSSEDATGTTNSNVHGASSSPVKPMNSNNNAVIVGKRKEKYCSNKSSPSGNQTGISGSKWCMGKPEELLYIDEDGGSTSNDLPTPDRARGKRTPTLIPVAPCPPAYLTDSMVRSCSVGFLDLVDAQLVPSDVALLMLRKEAPKRLVLVNRKNKHRRHKNKGQHTQDMSNSRTVSSTARPLTLKHCGKSRSLDSSEIFPTNNSANQIPSTKEKIPTEIPHERNQHQNQIPMVAVLSASSNSQESVHTAATTKPSPVTSVSLYKTTKTPVFAPSVGGNSLDGKCGALLCEKLAVREASSSHCHGADVLPTFDSLTARMKCRELLEESRSLPPPTPCASPRLPRSSPASPAPSKKCSKRNQSSSPIRKHLLNSPLLSRRHRKSKTTESSDDEVVQSGDEVFNGKNYRDLESFQKAQLRQKLKRGKCKGDFPDGSPSPQSPRQREFVMHNKAPMWNENSQVYQLDFGGRVTQESAKNFQIEFRGKQVMQFGRIDGNAYTLDFQYPFSALQAFAVALANVTQRLK